ncbi:alpha/beta hydrolase [Lactiplantibacillus pentosus]|uniref:alpha/beta hydrolase n=1 Tax=Lactiplantibacillus pentosus TaxID=1589 RepID=UPI001CD24AF8|nr:alpha/beta fold hydrolase [Lactiplantibacillus pentosus]MCA1343725.1 alpha/beta fold hydrolase [Lactiplantibacillus pentosus]MCJ8185777.1 alpha/beta fold hydrolase [Lactiplantibacillus pentosus]
MSIHSNHFYSNILRQPAQVQVILPEPLNAAGQVQSAYMSGDQSLPTIWLLHGLGGDATSWIRRTAIELLATQYRVAVVMPETGRGFYTNMAHGPRYWDYLTRELPTRMRYIFPLSARPADNYLLGNSMGGYGALRYALTYPQQFAAVAALSPVTDLKKFHVEQADIMPDFDLAFSPEQLQNTAVDLQYLLQHSNDWGTLRVLMTTGDQDILNAMDEAFRPQLAAVFKERFEWHSQAGHHDWQLWNQQLPYAIHWLIKGGWARV